MTINELTYLPFHLYFDINCIVLYKIVLSFFIECYPNCKCHAIILYDNKLNWTCKYRDQSQNGATCTESTTATPLWCIYYTLCDNWYANCHKKMQDFVNWFSSSAKCSVFSSMCDLIHSRDYHPFTGYRSRHRKKKQIKHSVHIHVQLCSVWLLY